MRIGKPILFVTILLATSHVSVFCQCYEDFIYSRADTIPNIYNEPDYSFLDNTKIVTLENGTIVIKVDTSTTRINSSIYPRLFHQSWNYGIYAISLKNCSISSFVDFKGKRQLAVLDYATSAISTYNISGRNPIGYDEASLYLAPHDFKFENKKYKNGTIISLNEKGLKIVKPVVEKHQSFDVNTVFYTNTFNVTKFLLYHVSKDCHTESHIGIRIRHKDDVVDSFEVVGNSPSVPNVHVANDTLIFHWTVSPSEKSTNDIYKKYYKSTLLGEWKQSIWADSFPVLNGNSISYYNVGDLLLLKVNCFSRDERGLKKMDGVSFTLNNIPLRAESKYYYLVLAFNINTNKFLGYPTVELTNKL